MCVRAGAEQDRVQPATEGARGVAGQPSLRLQAQGHRQSPEVIPPPPPATTPNPRGFCPCRFRVPSLSLSIQMKSQTLFGVLINPGSPFFL